MWLLATPGHTPGHQSVVIEANDGREVIAAQCAFHTDALWTGEPEPTNLHSPASGDDAKRSLARIRALEPVAVHASHDPEIISLR